jgi:transcriptional regulator with XRE-family HTH domain
VTTISAMQPNRKPAGEHLPEWRSKRRMSQLELASEAEISARHLSFLETGRSQASREMLLHLSDQLDIPLRERNVILVAAGYAPVFEERPLASPEMAAVRQAVERVLKGHEPFPALAVNRHWELVSANAAVARLLAGVDEKLLEPPVNVLRLSLHPSIDSKINTVLRARRERYRLAGSAGKCREGTCQKGRGCSIEWNAASVPQTNWTT